MNTIPTNCPFCGGQVTVTRLYCPECDTTIEGRFTYQPFAQLSSEQYRFIETFVRCEGKLNRMQDELGLSYPTIRNRLNEVIRALGYEPGGSDESEALTDEQRQDILASLESGSISADEALRMLKGKKE